MNSEFYTRLRQFMEYKSLNINEFSRKTGFSSGAVSKILNGQKNFGTDKLMNIFIVFPELKPQWLLLGEGEMVRDPNLETRTSLAHVENLEKQNLRLSAKVEALQELLDQFIMIYKEHPTQNPQDPQD